MPSFGTAGTGSCGMAMCHSADADEVGDGIAREGTRKRTPFERLNAVRRLCKQRNTYVGEGGDEDEDEDGGDLLERDEKECSSSESLWPQQSTSSLPAMRRSFGACEN